MCKALPSYRVSSSNDGTQHCYTDMRSCNLKIYMQYKIILQFVYCYSVNLQHQHLDGSDALLQTRVAMGRTSQVKQSSFT